MPGPFPSSEIRTSSLQALVQCREALPVQPITPKPSGLVLGS